MINTDTKRIFESYANNLIDEYHIPGTSIGINKDGERLYYKGFGYRDAEKGLLVNADSVFGIASVTKSFTCIAIMQLQEAGKLSIHDKVVSYLPEFHTKDLEKTEQITIHHFMTNSSGLPPLPSLLYANKRSMEIDPSTNDYMGLDIENDLEHEPIDTYEDLMKFIAELDVVLLGPPGKHFSYSNEAFSLLGATIERVSGLKYEDYIKQFILQPIGMVNSSFYINDLANLDNVTMLYAQKETTEEPYVYPAPVWWDAPSMRPAGYLKSSVNDMLKYADIFRNKGVVQGKRILSEESVKQMTYPYIEAEPGKYYGYGLIITPDYYGHTLIQHSGNLKAIASLMTIIPELGITGMVLTNLADVPASTILMGALNVYQGKNPDASHITFTDYEMTKENLKKYVGDYSSHEGELLTIGMDDNQLNFKTDGKFYPIKCVGEHLFLVDIKDQQEVLRFIVDDSGEVDRIAYHFRQFPRER